MIYDWQAPSISSALAFALLVPSCRFFTGSNFAKKHDIILLSDLAYAEIYFDENEIPTSILEVEGAKDIAVEFTSLSKSFSMPGGRMGFAVGNEYLISALTRIKSYLDYGAFTPIQVASAAALNSEQSIIDEIRKTSHAIHTPILTLIDS